MKKIHIITASAGSGKTYRLTELLEEKIATGQIRPEAVMATTFTRKAAAELEERVRQRLIAKGCPNHANRLSVARMGTINSICSRIVNDFAFENGLFPEAQVLDEVAAERELRRSASRVVTQSQTSRLAELDYLLYGLNWTAAVNDIITLARYNGLDQEGLNKSKEISIEGLKQLVGNVTSKKHNLEQKLENAFTNFTENESRDRRKALAKLQAFC